MTSQVEAIGANSEENVMNIYWKFYYDTLPELEEIDKKLKDDHRGNRDIIYFIRLQQKHWLQVKKESE